MTQETAYFAMGCFWGAERLFWQTEGVVETAVGYMGGRTDNPTYRDVCTRDTGHAETVKVVFDPSVVTFSQLCAIFFEYHDPTQVNRQGNDIGDQYRSAIFAATDAQFDEATAMAAAMDRVVQQRYGKPLATIVCRPGHLFHRAEEYHQRYLEKNPGGYCSIRRHGHDCPIV